MGRRAFILGGGGQIGRAAAGALLDRGWEVILASRGRRAPDETLVSRGIRTVVLDRDQPGDLAKAVADGADAVIDAVAYTQAHADQLLDLQGGVGAFVVVSSASVYRDEAGRSLDEAAQGGFPNFPEPIREAQATVDPGPETYSTRKVALERRLLDRAAIPATVVRPCAIHGFGSVHPREWWFVKRVLDRRPVIPLAYRGLSRFHTTATANIAALIGTVLDRPGTRVLNIADPEAPTVAEIGALIARRMSYQGELRLLDVGDPYGHAPIGSTPWSSPRPFVLDLKAAGALGYRPAVSYAEAVGPVCDELGRASSQEWKALFPVLAAYPEDLFDYAAEDRVLAAGR